MNNVNKVENEEKEEIMDCEPVVRTDGMTNTISTVQKDNLLVERERDEIRHRPLN